MNIPQAIVISTITASIAAISITLVIYNQSFFAMMVAFGCYGLMFITIL
jgi:hypothetical protein